jgi:poly-gamma-glutamate system protein
VIALGISGSFPALNLAAFAAIQTLGLKPIVISSAASSEWGANNPELTWLDMEQVLVERGVFTFRSVAASRGGIDDRGFGMTEEGQAILDRIIEKYALRKLEGASLKESIDQRMALYQELAESRPIKAYINIGGGSASVGTHVGKKQLKPGLNVEAPHGPGLVDSVMLRFIQQGVAVIHVSDISKLARRYGFPVEPQRTPTLGQGTIYARAEYNRWLAFIGALVVCASMLAFTRLDIGLRILRQNRPTERSEPQQMI